jgi:hypothetical protein
VGLVSLWCPPFAFWCVLSLINKMYSVFHPTAHWLLHSSHSQSIHTYETTQHTSQQDDKTYSEVLVDVFVDRDEGHRRVQGASVVELPRPASLVYLAHNRGDVVAQRVDSDSLLDVLHDIAEQL